ncbi:MAG: DUF4124 domain-containing protein [Thiohalophilus sp.]|jgi:hypothetical protein
MKKLLLIVLAVLIGGALYVYLNPELRDQTRQELDKLSGKDQGRTLYRWQDPDGQWQISDSPPQAGIPYETLRYDTEANVIPSENLTGRKEK